MRAIIQDLIDPGLVLTLFLEESQPSLLYKMMKDLE